MPYVTINLMGGRTAEQKKKLHEAVTKAICDSLHVEADKVRIQLVDMSPEDYSVGGTPKG